MKHIFPLLFLIIILLPACGPSPEEQATRTATAQTATAAMWTKTFTPTFTPTFTATATDTFTPTFTPTFTYTPTNTLTPTATLTPTITPFVFPKATVRTEQAGCMYGPSWEYLWQFGLVKGDTGEVKGRSPYNGWLYVKMDRYGNYCWIDGYQLNIVGDVNTVIVEDIRLPMTETGFYGPPTWVRAERDGDEVTITWAAVQMTQDDDRGYFLDLMVCQNGDLVWVPKHLLTQDQTSFTVEDEAKCSQYSGGMLYTVEKHGYVTPVKISWPR